VWNPGARRAAEPKAADIGPEHWNEFVCIEAGNVAEDAVRLAPGESSTINYELRLEPLPVGRAD
jgi:D-hexose-6-phosphate mutarotase